MCRLYFNLEESCGGGGRGINAFTASLCLELGPLLHQLIRMFFGFFLQFCSPGFLEVCHSLNAALSLFLFIYSITELEHLETEVRRLALAAPEVSPGSLVHIMSNAIRSAPD